MECTTVVHFIQRSLSRLEGGPTLANQLPLMGGHRPGFTRQPRPGGVTLSSSHGVDSVAPFLCRRQHSPGAGGVPDSGARAAVS